MSDTEDTLLSKAWLRTSRRRRWYGLMAVLVLATVAALVAVLMHRGGQTERPLSDRALAVLATQRAAARQNLALQARLRARTAAKLVVQARLRARAAAKR
jgi:hypothetical protein